MSYKFIIDTSALGEENAKLLLDAGLVQACNSGQLSFYMTPVLLSERCDWVRKGKNDKSNLHAMKLLTEIKWTKCFNYPGGLKGIIVQELLNEKSPEEYVFINCEIAKESFRYLLKNIDQVIKSDVDGLITFEARGKEYEAQKRDDILELRRKNAQRSTAIGFNDFKLSRFDTYALNSIEENFRYNNLKFEDKYVNAWKQNQSRYEYFDLSVNIFLFLLWYSVCKPNKPIDKNTARDLEHLLYLKDIDGIISEDNKLMKDAKNILFCGKDYYSVDEFISAKLTCPH